MRCILALDAAWTATEPSGVALVQGDSSGWRCVAVAPSYDEFVSVAKGRQIDWSRPNFKGTHPNALGLLDAARQLAGSDIDLITIDMPIATVAIASRRAADDAVSTEFGSRWCSAHTPNSQRPGALGAALSSAFRNCGYPLRATTASRSQTPCLLEVYPHPALLSC
jgi:predicted RNase H-like nuclease